MFTRVFAEHGLPTTLYLEKGIWKSSKLVTGGSNAKKAMGEGDMPFSWAECEMGLRQYGIDFIHARRARSKPVERVGGLLQDLMGGEPSYCGRNERFDQPEVVTLHERSVNSKKEHPSEFFPSFGQWEARLQAICEQYNATPQQGRRLDNISPDAAFELYRDKEDPPAFFDATCRYLLAHHRVPVTVRNEGIRFRIGGEQYVYFGEETGGLVGKRMLAWFNPELPELLAVTDMNHKNAFTIARRKEVCALGINESDREEVAKTYAHASVAKARYRTLKAKFQPAFRRNLVAASTIELGEQFAQQRQRIESSKKQEDSRARKIHRLASEVEMPTAILGDGREAEGYLELMREAERCHEQESSGEGTKE